MPQLRLPIFPACTTLITPEIVFECREGKVTSSRDTRPYSSIRTDVAAFRYFTSQLVVHGTVG
jgi:hypothetical protein